MRLEHYEVRFDEPFTSFQFVGEGRKGRIRKSVQLSPMGGNLYNLALGDVDAQTGQVDDLVVTDNGDDEKVLATVVEIVYRFCDRFPWARIYATGSTPARTRLYRMGINKHYRLAVEDFFILGQRPDDEREPFQKDGDYQAFIGIKKEVSFGT